MLKARTTTRVVSLFAHCLRLLAALWGITGRDLSFAVEMDERRTKSNLMNEQTEKLKLGQLIHLLQLRNKQTQTGEA